VAVSSPFVVAFVVGVTPGKWARVWAERLPHVPLELRQLNPAEALSAVESCDADVALLRLPVDNAWHSAIRLYEEQPVVVAPKDHAIEAADDVVLADLTDLLPDGDWADQVELIAANVGVAVMPQSVARALSRKDVVVRPVTDAPTTTVALVWPTARTTDLVDEFIGIVRGRSANSSRGVPTPPTPKPAKRPKPDRRPNRRR